MDGLYATSDPGLLTRFASDMIDAGRVAAAHAVLAAARRAGGPSPRLSELSARLALREDRLEEARRELDTAIAVTPDHAGLRKLRADLRRRLGELPGAALDAAEAVVLDRNDPAAKAILGVLMLDLGRPADAAACLTEAVAADPADPAFREALAAAQASAGAMDAAAATLAAGIAAAPGRVELRNAAVLLEVRRGRFEAAVGVAEAARRDGVTDACLFGLLGHALSCLGRHAEAGDAYEAARKLGPHDPYVRHLVAAAGGLPGDARAPADYVRAVFDGYAERFEAHLIALGYRIPGLIRAALRRHAALPDDGRAGPVLDLGCGTGLVAVAISDLPLGPLFGVDLSPRMLALAQAKGLYAELRVADLMEVLGPGAPEAGGQGGLSDPDLRYPFVLAADVLCYFGDLHDVLDAVRGRLRPGGLFVFSVEALAEDGGGGWSLGSLGRYGHTARYVREAVSAAGFSIREIAQETLRFEAGSPVAGFIVVLERPRHDN